MKLIQKINRITFNRREKLGIMIAGGALLLILLLHLGIFPLIESRRKMHRFFISKTAMIQEMQNLQEEYRSLVDQSVMTDNRLSGRGKNFSLFSFLEEMAGHSGIKNKITYMKPSMQQNKDSGRKIASIEMKLESMSSKELVDYLYIIETRDPLIAVKRMSVFKSDSSTGRLQAILQIETIES